MSGRKINEKTVSIPEVKKIMESVKEKIMQVDPEEGMSHFQEITYDYVNKFAKLDAKIAAKIQKVVMEKYQIEDIFAVNIVNIDPKTIPELRVILEKSASGKVLNDEKLRELLSQIQELKTS